MADCTDCVVNSLGTATDVAPSQNALAVGFGASDGAKLVGFGTTTVLARLNTDIYLTDYANLADGEDWTSVLIAAEAAAFAKGSSLRIPAGFFGYSADLTFRCELYGAGVNSTFLVKLAPATITFLSGVMRDLTIGPLAAVIAGDTTHGLILAGLDRKFIENVCSRYHGGDGIQYQRGNLTRVSIQARFNNGHGVFCPKETISGDNKGLEGWVEATASGLSGFVVEESDSAIQIGGQFGCTIKAQGNGTRNVADDNYDLILTGTGHTIPNIYQESGTGSVWLKSTLKMSRMTFGQDSWIDFRNEADDTNSVNWLSAPGVRATTVENLQKLNLRGLETLVGQLTMYQMADRFFLLDAIGSSAAQTLSLGSALNLAKQGLRYGRIVDAGATIASFAVAAGTIIQKSIALPTLTAALPAHVAPAVSPRFNDASLDSLIWCGKIVGGTDPTTDPAIATINIANPTAVSVIVPTGAWSFVFEV